MSTALDRDQFDRISRVVFESGEDVPDSAYEMAVILLLDTLAIAAGAVPLKPARIARELVCDIHGATGRFDAPMLFDGRLVSLPGAAFAAATQIDNLDGHDGYNPTKGHIGCASVPALFAFAAQKPDLSGREALATLIMSYEIAARAAIALHASVPEYHTSGAWNGLGVAAIGCRLLGTDAETLRQALGIAEYHGPRSQMMREIEYPTMLHDGSGMGALTGAMAVLMALRGFEGAPAITVEAASTAPHWADLGADWTIEKNYIKPYPICRWAHAALDSVYKIQSENEFGPGDIASVKIATFHQAACLFPGMPGSTSEAQYSLPFAVAVMLRHGRVGTEHITGDALADPEVAALLARIEVEETAVYNDRFPDGRWSDATITLKNGQVLTSGEIHARGGPENPMDPAEIRTKYNAFMDVSVTEQRATDIWDAGHRLLDADTPFSTLADLVTASPDKVD